MSSAKKSYQLFVNWVQADMKRDRFLVNKKIFGVVFWCLLLPAILSIVLFGLRKYQVVVAMRFADLIIFLPPFVYALYSIWPTIRQVPHVFKKGGMGALLDESMKEVEWREGTVARMKADINLTPAEWSLISFHLRSDLERISQQNRYMTILASVVLFFMFQFLDLGAPTDIIIPETAGGLVQAWVNQFYQWSIQVLSLLLFSALFYLSGLQFHRYLTRYLICIERINIDQ